MTITMPEAPAETSYSPFCQPYVWLDIFPHTIDDLSIRWADHRGEPRTPEMIAQDLADTHQIGEYYQVTVQRYMDRIYRRTV